METLDVILKISSAVSLVSFITMIFIMISGILHDEEKVIKSMTSPDGGYDSYAVISSLEIILFFVFVGSSALSSILALIK